MVEIEEKEPLKRNNLNTKHLPPIFMLVAGFVSLIISIVSGYESKKLLIIVFISMLVFAIIGTIIKTIVDSFNMKFSYDDLLDNDDEGEVREK